MAKETDEWSWVIEAERHQRWKRKPLCRKLSDQINVRLARVMVQSIVCWLKGALGWMGKSRNGHVSAQFLRNQTLNTGSIRRESKNLSMEIFSHFLMTKSWKVFINNSCSSKTLVRSKHFPTISRKSFHFTADYFHSITHRKGRLVPLGYLKESGTEA